MHPFRSYVYPIFLQLFVQFRLGRDEDSTIFFQLFYELKPILQAMMAYIVSGLPGYEPQDDESVAFFLPDLFQHMLIGDKIVRMEICQLLIAVEFHLFFTDMALVTGWRPDRAHERHAEDHLLRSDLRILEVNAFFTH